MDIGPILFELCVKFDGIRISIVPSVVSTDIQTDKHSHTHTHTYILTQASGRTDRQIKQTDRRTEDGHRQTDERANRQTGWPTDKQTNRHTDRQTERQTDRKIDRQTDRQTYNLAIIFGHRACRTRGNLPQKPRKANTRCPFDTCCKICCCFPP